MGNELEPSLTHINKRNIDIASTIGQLLPRGHAIHGYSDSRSNRMFMVLNTASYSDKAPLLGFGIDGNAELALARALVTYAIRETEGLDFITEKQLPESSENRLPPGSNNSRFDNIVWGSDIKLYQDGHEFVAASNHGGPGIFDPVEVRAVTPLGALELLTDTYRFINPTVKMLPAITLQYVPFN